MNLQQKQAGAAQKNLHLAVWRRVHGMWFCRSFLASGLRIELPDTDQTGRNFASADVCMTSLLWFQHHLSPVTNRQPTAKDVFSDHFALIKCSCHNSGCEDACKSFLPRQNKAEKLFRKEPKPLKPILKEYWKYHLLLLTIESVPLQHKLNLGPDERSISHQNFAAESIWPTSWGSIVLFLGLNDLEVPYLPDWLIPANGFNGAD